MKKPPNLVEDWSKKLNRLINEKNPNLNKASKKKTENWWFVWPSSPEGYTKEELKLNILIKKIS